MMDDMRTYRDMVNRVRATIVSYDEGCYDSAQDALEDIHWIVTREVEQ